MGGPGRNYHENEFGPIAPAAEKRPQECFFPFNFSNCWEQNPFLWKSVQSPRDQTMEKRFPIYFGPVELRGVWPFFAPWPSPEEETRLHFGAAPFDPNLSTVGLAEWFRNLAAY